MSCYNHFCICNNNEIKNIVDGVSFMLVMFGIIGFVLLSNSKDVDVSINVLTVSTMLIIVGFVLYLYRCLICGFPSYSCVRNECIHDIESDEE